MADPTHLSFWGKARPTAGDAAPYHPVAYHLLDVAAVTEAILLARPLGAARTARLLGLDVDEVRTLLVALAALHDLGKFAPAFQAKAPEVWPACALGPYSDTYAVPRRRHTEDGYVLWDDVLAARLGKRIWAGGDAALFILAPAVFGHHGRPVGAGFGRDPARARFRAGLAAAEACADTVVALLSPRPVESIPPIEDRARLASWAVSGLITVADWIGSNEGWFPYAAPDASDPTLETYWERARAQAEAAVRQAGLLPRAPSKDRSFAEIARVPGAPTPVQEWAAGFDLPDGPTLVVIEDVTGSGKTEAAQMLVHRLMAAGRATGAYWALPTMATANAMYERQGKAIRALYVAGRDGVTPSLVLAHGQQRLHEGFRSTVLGVAGERPALKRDGDEEDLDSAVACAAFLADDRRAALFADVGVGTVDQAILGVLPSRFNTMRLLGLSDKVLVIDEAHAYDAYMSVEIQELLRFQAALGGCAILLSATLSRKQRAALAQAWTDGVSGGGRRAAFGGGVQLASSKYPLATVVSDEPVVREVALDAAAWSRRRVTVRLVHDVEGAIQHVLDSSARGGAVAWVRNTVDDCLEAAARLRERGIEPLVFHARFAQGDRQRREAEVLALFGKDAPTAARRGRVLVATQVIEQSLDLDFDAMASDVAPIDLLVQRAGRLWRHGARTDTGRPDGLMMELVVLSPQPTAEPPSGWLGGVFAGTAHVYEDAGVLWRTVQMLASTRCIDTPDGLRDLVERVYGRDEELPESLLPLAQRAEGKQSAHAATANYGVLKAPDGYHADAVAWVSDVRMPTRLGDARTTVRLARVRADGGLEPWVRAEGPPWKSWALSEVSVPEYRVPKGSMPEARYAEAVAQARAGWGRWEQDTPVLPLRDTLAAHSEGTLTAPDGETRRFRYTAGEGLAYSKGASAAPATT